MDFVNFWLNFKEKTSDQKMLNFSHLTYLVNASALPGKTGNPKIVSSLKCSMLFYQQA